MVKFFREHQKWILLVMAVLMVAFLVPSMGKWHLGGGGDTRPYAQYVLDGKPAKLTYQEVVDSHSELLLLEELSKESPRSGMLADELRQYIYNNMERETGGAAWALWVQLAEHDNFVATEADRKGFYSDYQLTDAIVNRVRDRSSTTISAIESAINHWLAVRKMTQLAATQHSRAPGYMLEALARDLTEAAQVNVVRPDLTLFTRLAGSTVTPDVLKAQFKKYSDKTRGPKGSPVGYRVPDQIGVEVLGIDVLAMISDDAAKDFYRKNPGQFMETVPTTQPAPSPAASQPTSQPAVTKRLQPLTADLIRQIKLTLATSQPEKAATPATQPAKPPADRAYDALFKAAEAISKQTSYNPATDTNYLLAEGRIEQALHVKPFRISTKLPFSTVDLLEELDKPAPESPASSFGNTPRDLALLLTQGVPFRQIMTVVVGGQAVRNLDPARLAFMTAQPLVGERKDTQPLQIGQQVPLVFAQGQGHLFIWRLTAARPSYVPDLNQVEGQVQSDVIRARATDAAEAKLRAIATAVAASNGPTLDKAVDAANADLARQLKALPPTTQPAGSPTTQPVTAAAKPTTAPDANAKFLTVVNRVELYRQRLSVQPIDRQEIWRRAGGNPDIAEELYDDAMAQSWDLLPGEPPAELPSRQLIKSAFDLAGRFARHEAKPDKLLGVVNDPDTAVCALLQLVDVVGSADKSAEQEKEVRMLFGARQYWQFKQSWFNIFRRLEYRGPKRGQQQQEE